MIKKTTLSLALIASLSLIGCGSSSSDTADTGDTISKTITVERGAAYDAIVTDANGQIAIQDNGKNTYVFATTPALPISVNGGWIDVDGDGELTTNDIKLELEMKSYTSNVTPLTTYLANSDANNRDTILNDLVNASGATKEELLKVASTADIKAIIAINAIYKEMKENNSTSISIDNLETVMSALGNVDVSGLTSSKEIALKIEQATMDALLGDGKVTKITFDEMDELQSIRIFDTKWVNKKSDARFIGNTVKVVDDKLELTANPKDNNDSKAELKSDELNTKGTSFTSTFKVLSIGDNGSARIQTHTYYDGKSFISFAIKIRPYSFTIFIYNIKENNGVYTDTEIYNYTVNTENNTSIIDNVFTTNIKVDGDNIIFSINNDTTNKKYDDIVYDMSTISDLDESSKKLEKLVVHARVDNESRNPDSNISTKIQLLNLELIAPKNYVSGLLESYEQTNVIKTSVDKIDSIEVNNEFFVNKKSDDRYKTNTVSIVDNKLLLTASLREDNDSRATLYSTLVNNNINTFTTKFKINQMCDYSKVQTNIRFETKDNLYITAGMGIKRDKVYIFLETYDGNVSRDLLADGNITNGVNSDTTIGTSSNTFDGDTFTVNIKVDNNNLIYTAINNSTNQTYTKTIDMANLANWNTISKKFVKMRIRSRLDNRTDKYPEITTTAQSDDKTEIKLLDLQFN